ncbi:hypothetical protein HW555_010105, partial [Spodoptera exigua]
CTLRLALDIQMAVVRINKATRCGAYAQYWLAHICMPAVILPTDLILIPQVFACSHAIRPGSPARQSLILTRLFKQVAPNQKSKSHPDVSSGGIVSLGYSSKFLRSKSLATSYIFWCTSECPCFAVRRYSFSKAEILKSFNYARHHKSGHVLREVALFLKNSPHVTTHHWLHKEIYVVVR